MKAKNTEPMSLIDVIKHGYFQQVRFLVERGENIDQRDSERRTALMLCSFLEPEVWGVGISRLLIENGGKLYCRDIYGLNAFHYACIYERVELVKVFLKAIDFNLLQGDKQGNTALHYAVKAGNDVIVRLITLAYMKYRISFDKQNNDGFTVLEEAYRCNNRKCVRIIENPEVLSDIGNIEANIPLDLRFSDVEHETRSIRGSRKSLSRPRSSVVSHRPRSSAMSHRSSKSSLLTHTESYYRRSPTIYSYDAHRYRRIQPDIAVPPYEKNNKNIIYLASASDLRNNPEYLFHLAPALEESAEGPQNLPPNKRPRAKSAFVRRSEVLTEKQDRSISWRTELKRLYVHFQYQCTPSYRDTVHFDPEVYLPNVDKPPLTPSNSEHALVDDENKSKKGRGKSAVARQGTQESLGHGKGKSPAQTTSKSRKVSAIGIGHGGKLTASADGSLESSSESINSLASSKKSANKDVGGGRQSRAANYKNVADDSHSSVQTPEQASQDQSRLRVIDE